MQRVTRAFFCQKRLTVLAFGAFVTLSSAWGDSPIKSPMATKPAEATAQDAYRLASQDQLKIYVFEWRVGEMHQWDGLTGTFTVNSSGNLALPIVGFVTARNRTIRELSEEIAERLKVRAGLPKSPGVSIEIAKYRPFYVSGDVQQPGEFDYRPGLTTTKVLAIGGGIYRMQEAAGLNTQHRLMAAEGMIEGAMVEMRSLIARQARLSFEISQIERLGVTKLEPEAEIPHPSQLPNTAEARALIDDERKILSARLGNLKSQVNQLQRTIKLLKNELISVQEKTRAQRQQLQLANEERRRIDKMWQKQLVVAARRLQTQRIVADLESRVLDLDSARMRFELDRAKAERDVSDVIANYTAETVTELLRAENRIKTLRSTIATQSQMLRSGRLMTDRSSFASTLQTRVTYEITRRQETFVAGDHVSVLPGDVVKVIVERLENSKTVSDGKAPMVHMHRESARVLHMGSR